MNRDALRSDYTAAREWLEDRARKNLLDLLVDARDEFRRRHPDVSAPKYPEVRVKAFAKIIDKVTRKGRDWEHDTIYVEGEDGSAATIVNDVIAGRVVCATLVDVDKLVTILREWPNRLSDVTEQRISKDDTGYRAYHLDAKIEVDRGQRRLRFPVEIQIKTLLQDAWANFDHDELYKTDDEPPEVTKKISKQVADILHALDQIGQTIRDEKLRKRPADAIGMEETLVTQRTLNYLVDQVFGVTMSEVELNRCVEQLKAFDYMSLAAVGDLARDAGVQAMVGAAKAELRLPGDLTPSEILYFGPVAVKEGQAGVVAEMRRVYSLTENSCDGCGAPISRDEELFNKTQTDLDEVYFCSRCRATRLKKCDRCDRFTESGVCKDCRSVDVAVEIV